MKRLACTFVLLCSGACGNNGPAAVPGQPAAFFQPNLNDPATKTPADLSCLGAKTDPAAPTTPTTVAMTVKDFEKGTVLAGATVDVFTSLDKIKTNAPDFTSAPSDAQGQTMVTVPAGFYRVIFRTTADPQKTIETIEFNRKYNDSERISVSIITKQEIPALVSITPDDSLGVVAGSLRDCNEKELGGITFSATSTGGAFDASMTTFYFVDVSGMTVPSRTQKFTSGDGAFAILNVPPGDVTVTANGLVTAGGMLKKLGSAVIPVHPNSITIVQMEPLGPGMM
jgi:hypothetical protein